MAPSDLEDVVKKDIAPSSSVIIDEVITQEIHNGPRPVRVTGYRPHNDRHVDGYNNRTYNSLIGGNTVGYFKYQYVR